MAYIVMAYIVMAYSPIGDIGWYLYIVMAYIVMAYIVMAYSPIGWYPPDGLTVTTVCGHVVLIRRSLCADVCTDMRRDMCADMCADV